MRVGSARRHGEGSAQEAKRVRDGGRGPGAAGENPRRADRESFEEALKVVLETEAGRQLGELRAGPHGREKADQWQEELAGERAEERAEAPGWSSSADPVGRKEQE